MKPTERPILFRPELVRAILEGRKTVTRRLVKGEALRWLTEQGFTPEFVSDPANHLCPYGDPGDALWVRETWRQGDGGRIGSVVTELREGSIFYLADELHNKGAGWRPSIFMPRWACRLVLPIVSRRVERLWEITEEDAKAEGVEPRMDSRAVVVGGRVGFEITDSREVYRNGFSYGWDAINAKRGDWESNPWVWRIEFPQQHKEAA